MTDLLTSTFMGMSTLELLASGLGVLSVGLTIIRSIWCWPIGAVMVALYVFIFWQAKLYADSGLQLVYFFLQIYGWWYWLGGAKQTNSVRISRTPQRLLISSLLTAGILSIITGFLLHRYTDQAMPYGDAAVTVFSLVAQIFMTRKHLENWLLWIFIDLIACIIYAAKGLYPTAVLYTLFLAMAIAGWREWKKAMLVEA